MKCLYFLLLFLSCFGGRVQVRERSSIACLSGHALAAFKDPPTGGSWASGLGQGLKQPGMQRPSWSLRNTSVNKAAGKEVITQTAGLQKTKILHTPNSTKQCGWVPHDSTGCLPCGTQPSPTAGHSSEQLGNDWAGAPGKSMTVFTLHPPCSAIATLSGSLLLTPSFFTLLTLKKKKRLEFSISHLLETLWRH